MNRYMIVCRLRWPAFLLLTGVIALLDQMDLLSWGRAWPLYLILFGVLALAERAALASQPNPPQQPDYPYAAGYPQPGYSNPGYPNPGYSNPGYSNPGYAPPAGNYPPQPAPAQPVATSTSIVPAHSDLEIQSSDAPREARKSWEEEER
jgi:hypothetical protein